MGAQFRTNSNPKQCHEKARKRFKLVKLLNCHELNGHLAEYSKGFQSTPNGVNLGPGKRKRPPSTVHEIETDAKRNVINSNKRRTAREKRIGSVASNPKAAYRVKEVGVPQYSRMTKFYEL